MITKFHIYETLENYRVFEPWKKENIIYVYKCIYFHYANKQYDLTLPGENEEVLDYETGNKVNWNSECEDETLLFYNTYFKNINPEVPKFLGYEIDDVVEFVEKFHIQKEAEKYNL